MAKRGDKKVREPIGNPADSEGFFAHMLRYLDWMRVTNYSERTLTNKEDYLRTFIEWCDARGLERPGEVTKPILERYQRHLYYKRKANGKPLSSRSQYVHLVPVRGYFKWLTKQNYILYNPASELDLPKLEKRLPKHILTEREAETVLAQADLSASMGLRDRAMLETLYSTGMRRLEIINLKTADIDHDRGTIMIRQGKNRKDRMVPVGDRCLFWINRYQEELRPQIAIEPDDDVLFLNTAALPLSCSRLTALVRKYVDAAKINKRGSCHLFRHTMATLMLENGADIRFIQAMLGHAELSTTQIYTQVSIKQLKKVHSLTHPGKIGSRVFEEEEDRAQISVEGKPSLETAKQELFSTLAAEAKSELH